MIFPSRKINFIHVPKAAGSSIGKCLLDAIPNSPSDLQFQADFAEFSKIKGFPFPNHAPAYLRREFMGETTYSEYFSFAFVRNPFDLVVSVYEYTRQVEYDIFKENKWELNRFQKNIIDNTFDDWVNNFATGNPQHTWLFSEEGEILINFLGKTEHFHQDFKLIKNALDVSTEKTLEKQNATTRSDYKQYFTEQSRETIEKRYARDLELFGYRF